MVRSLVPRLTDIVEATTRIRDVMGEMPLEVFEADWQAQWLVERGTEIFSEASRHPEIPWQKVAGIGNVLRHDYQRISAAVLWKLAKADLQALENACRAELDHEVEGD